MNIRKIIREEVNDFDWAKGPINPWLEYDGIVFDIEPTREDVNKYIEMALTTRNFSNASEWTENVRKEDIDNVIDSSYLGVYGYDGNLGYPNESEHKDGNVILYSILIGQNK